ncbi:hypothetical protein [Sphingomonas sp.]|uniref:hypothetical protein n=1 Tax=Sphingomonas sp. TaxID=28214 RepID=UPI001B0949DB|nr:hypothetical protein [Sphingomonas sp.]MBO9715053.1 hypothetical protein [Sphingomonas sp.]
MKALALLAALAVATPAAAKDTYQASWLISPVEPAPGSTVTIRPGDVITQARLVPAGGLVALQEDAVGVDGAAVGMAGTQMMRLRASVGAACTFAFPVDTGLKVLLFRGQRFTCMVDADADGRFESAFQLSSSTIGIPPAFGAIPSKRVAIRPVRYAELPLSEATALPRLLFKYSHQDKITGYAYLGICIGNSTTKREPCFDGYFGVRGDKLPKPISVAGNVVEAVAKDGAAVTLVVRHGFDPMPFVGEERTAWRFY